MASCASKGMLQAMGKLLTSWAAMASAPRDSGQHSAREQRHRRCWGFVCCDLQCNQQALFRVAYPGQANYDEQVGVFRRQSDSFGSCRWML